MVAGTAQSMVAGSREWDQKQGLVIILYMCVCLPLSPFTLFPPLVSQTPPSEGSTALRAPQTWKQVLRIQA